MKNFDQAKNKYIDLNHSKSIIKLILKVKKSNAKFQKKSQKLKIKKSKLHSNMEFQVPIKKKKTY